MSVDLIDSDDTHSDILHSNQSLTIARKRRSSNKNKNGLQQQLVANDINNEMVSSNSDETMDTQMMETFETENKMNTNAHMSERNVHGQTKTSHAFWNLCKCYVGAASFALPWAVSKTGLIPSISGFILLSSLAWLTFRWMLIASHYAVTKCNPTYPELAQCAFNKFFLLFGDGQINSSHVQQSNVDTVNSSNMFIEMQNDQMDENQISDEEHQRFIEKHLHNLHTNKYEKCNYRCGMTAKIIVYICMFFGMIGACGSYILFISSVIQSWLSSLIDPDSSLSFYISICILLPFPICLSMLRSYSFLSSTAKFGVAGVVLALCVTMYDGVLHINDGDVTQKVIDSNMTIVDLSGFPIFVGNACFLFVIHAMILSQEQSMIDRTRHSVSTQFNKANNLSLFLVTAINMIFSVFSYVAFLNIVPFPDNIVDALDEGIIQQITRACLCVDLLFTYALIMYPFTEALDAELFDVTQLTNDRKIICKGNAIRIFIVIMTALIAIGVPHFGYLTGLTGGSASTFLGFVLPPIFIWRLAPHKIHWIELYVLCPMVFMFGCVMCVWSPYLILSQMYKSD